ncbi:InlB B-repeat-containing protein [Bifidobacterium saguini]|nr:InlB B-repeat-containing protein [Bifidobacterium saguini]QTB90708.1 InlB B-repeat-containing protein [Bifidobacterium saguini]
MVVPAAIAQDSQPSDMAETMRDPTARTGIEQDQNIHDDISLMLVNNQYPTNGWLKFYQKDAATEISSKQINVSSQSSYTMPDMSGVNGIDYHYGQGYSGTYDWIPIAWKSQNFNVGGPCDAAWSLSVCRITDGGSFGAASSGVNNYFKPGDRVTPPTASGSSSWWAIYHKSFPVFSQVVRYNANGGTGSMSPSIPNISNLDLNNANRYGAYVTLSQNKFTRAGYKFVGWEREVTGTVFQPGDTPYVSFTDSPYDDNWPPIFKAKWEKAEPITIRYDGNGAASGSVGDQQSYKDQETEIETNGFAWPEHEFQGWNTKKDGTGTAYQPGDRQAFSADTTLYAQWKTLNATIHYDGNGATSGSVGDQTGAIGSTVKASGNGFLRESYMFKQWNTKKDGAGVAYQPGSDITVPESGMTLYAIWTPVAGTLPATGGIGLALALIACSAGVLVSVTVFMIRRRRA